MCLTPKNPSDNFHAFIPNSENRESNNSYENVQNRNLFVVSICSIDIYIGTLEEKHITNKYLVASRPYYNERLTWCVQKRKLVPVHKKILYFCTDERIFIIFGIELSLASFIIYFMQQFERHPKWDCLRITIAGIYLFFGYPCTFKPENNANRMLFIWTLFAAILYTIVLSTGSIHVLSSDIYNRQVETIHEILQNDFDLVGNEFTLQKLLQKNQVKFKNYTNVS